MMLPEAEEVECNFERVFECSYRVEKARSRERGGAGLGLSMARFAVEANRGKLRVENAEGKGTTFRVVLPLTTDRQQAKEDS